MSAPIAKPGTAQESENAPRRLRRGGGAWPLNPPGSGRKARQAACRLSACAGLLLLLGACSKTPAKPGATATNAPSEVGQNPIAAPVEYIGALGRAKQVAEKTIDLVGINQGIQLFYAAEGRYPKNLEELVTEGHLREIPKAPYGSVIQYNPQTGQVRIVKSP